MYSIVLREKILDAVGWGMSKAEAALRLGISTVKRYVSTGDRGPGGVPADRCRASGSAGTKRLGTSLPLGPSQGWEKISGEKDRSKIIFKTVLDGSEVSDQWEEVLRITLTSGEEALPVFSSEDEARMFLELEALGNTWRESG